MEAIGAATVVTARAELTPTLANAVLDSFQEEVNKEVEEMLEKLTGGALDEEGIERRKERSEEILTKIDVYEQALNEDLAGLRRIANLCKQAAITAALKQMPAMAL